MHHEPLHGLTTATHTPFRPDDASLDLSAVERQAELMARWQVRSVFVGGSTGESASLTTDERLRLARRWCEATRGSALRVVVHVGANSLEDARALAADAQRAGAAAVAALSPSYFKPRTVDDLLACCAYVADAAPGTPFYFYDIPVLTGVSLPMPEFLEKAAAAVPTLAGLKFTNPDLMAYQLCLRAGGGRFDVPFGIDEAVLGALAVGGRGAVGSGYNFAAPVYRRLFDAFARGDLATAREEQYRGVLLVRLLASFGYMAAAKATMGMLGVEVGPPRLPHRALAAENVARLRGELEALGYFDWIR